MEAYIPNHLRNLRRSLAVGSVIQTDIWNGIRLSYVICRAQGFGSGAPLYSMDRMSLKPALKRMCAPVGRIT